MVDLKLGRDNLDRKRVDIDRVTHSIPGFEQESMLNLGIVTGATQLGAAGAYRWTYQVTQAWMQGAGYVPRPNGLSFSPAYSVSELSTANLVPQVVGYGTIVANLPAGFVPVQIPVGSAVVVTPHRKSDGTLVWLIINTQAIDGVCAP